MTDLLKAAKQALEALESDSPDIQLRAAVALRTALYVGVPEHEKQAVCEEHYASEKKKPIKQTKEWVDITSQFNRWWHKDDSSENNPFGDDTPAFWAFEGWHACAVSKPNTPKQPDSLNELVRRVRETYGDAIILINQDELNVIHVKERSK